MGVKIYKQNIQKVLIGSTKIIKIYKGNKLIFAVEDYTK